MNGGKRKFSRELLKKNNMKLENQVISVELAKRLKDLGVNQESVFYWQDLLTNHPDNPWILSQFPVPQVEGKAIEKLAAFSVAEMGELLPKGFSCGYRWNDVDSYFCEIKTSDGVFTELGDSEANVRAKLLIFLLNRGM